MIRVVISASITAALADFVIGARAGRTGSGSGVRKLSSMIAISPCTTCLMESALWNLFSWAVVFFSRSWLAGLENLRKLVHNWFVSRLHFAKSALNRPVVAMLS